MSYSVDVVKRDAMIWGLYTVGCIVTLTSTTHPLLLGAAMVLSGVLAYTVQDVLHPRPSHQRMLGIFGVGALYAVCSWLSPLVLVFEKIQAWAVGTAWEQTVLSWSSDLWKVAKWVDPTVFVGVSLLMAVGVAICIFHATQPRRALSEQSFQLRSAGGQ